MKKKSNHVLFDMYNIHFFYSIPYLQQKTKPLELAGHWKQINCHEV